MMCALDWPKAFEPVSGQQTTTRITVKYDCVTDPKAKDIVYIDRQNFKVVFRGQAKNGMGFGTLPFLLYLCHISSRATLVKD